jgi:hypothetical protein
VHTDVVATISGCAPGLTCQAYKHSTPALMSSRLYHHLLIVLVSLVSTQALYATTPTPTPTPATRTVKVAWKASSSPEVVGYKVFWGTGSHNYQNVSDVKSVLTTSLTLSQNSEYYVAVVAYTTTDSSWFSNEVVVPASSAPW